MIEDSSKSMNPVSTYRVQFSSGFGFRELVDILDYLHDLGIRTIYASPILEAIPGSTHGYNVSNPARINPELGNMYDFISVRNKAAQLSINWIQDIVPNHMAYSTHNPWINDVLTYGRKSSYASYFDIDWDHPDKELNGKIMLPFFGKPKEELIKDGELSIEYHEQNFFLKYYENRYPLNEDSVALLMLYIKNLKDQAALKGNPVKKKPGGELLAELISEKGEEYLRRNISEVNQDKEIISRITDVQYYAPFHWKESSRKINYRRFFTINDLIGLKIENREVFNSYHQLISDLNKRNLIQGVRVDHIDGLRKPGQYLRRLRSLLGEDSYIIVEKILEKDEELPSTWPVQGTSGYDFTSLVNNLLTNNKHEDDFSKIYTEWTGREMNFEDLAYRKQSFIIYERMNGDLENLTRRCMSLDPDNTERFSVDSMKQAIAEFLIACPVYKIYRENLLMSKEQEDLVRNIINDALSNKPQLAPELDYLEEIFTNEQDEKYFDYFCRIMQFSGALMAKGMEDTLFYTYSRFVAHNEVGDSPGFFGIDRKHFHQEMIKRQENNPLSMNSTSTHDSKRGEDARARLSVISDIPELWRKYVFRWKQINSSIKKGNDPVLNDEYYIYQSLAGSYPIKGKHTSEYEERFTGYILKSLKESKEITSWADPDEEYEKSVSEFISRMLSHEEFMESYLEFHQIIADHGLVNSLSQLLLKITCPGTPDFYQGSESWNFNFTDPDNRRPVDFSTLYRNLQDISENPHSGFDSLWEQRENGKIKLWISNICLKERIHEDGFFSNSDYIPLEVDGEYKKHVAAFLRKDDNKTYLVAVPLNLAEITGSESYAPEKINWSKTYLCLPAEAPLFWFDMFSGKEFKSGQRIMLNKLFMEKPVAFLKGSSEMQERKAGILMHISSLPGKFGVGDMGPEAYKFIDFLYQARQTYWQILPLTSTNPEGNFSPYSALSAFAGNIMFISPQLLFEEGLIEKSTLSSGKFKSCRYACYDAALDYKREILHEARLKFMESKDQDSYHEFMEFCSREAYWLDDYALFVYFKDLFENKPWNQWPDEIKNRNEKSLQNYIIDEEEELLEIKFQQYLFMKQWEMLRDYAKLKGIRIFGDIPIYVSYDSADVWAHPTLFSLNGNKEMEKVAGVPPDYFNDTGQLWNMPLYRWELMRKNNFKWWIQRLHKNLELYDVVRIDHFRAFSNYWEVPGGHDTAVKGKWVKGPGDDFFRVIKKEFPSMPFVAEDLGDIDQAVYDLRDRFGLPGMHVLQFAFGEDMPSSVHIPHNHLSKNIVYSGTHDNNTLQGWYRSEMDSKSKKRIQEYLGKTIKKEEVHFEVIRMCYASPAKIAIVPMQDWLGYRENSRMNIPSTKEGNWLWRMGDEGISQDVVKKIRKYSKIYGRC